MELKEFVSQSLVQLFEGVRQAQAKTKEIGGSVATKIVAPKRDSQAVIGFNHNDPVILVDFDVSINTVDITNSKAGLGLFVAAFGGGAQAGSESSNNQLSRLRFSVPVVLPSSNDPGIEQ
jgi:hypothetical protein